jgi:hypothetical protein
MTRLTLAGVAAVACAAALGGRGSAAQPSSPLTRVQIPIDAAWQRESAGGVPARPGFRSRCGDSIIGLRGATALEPAGAGGLLVGLALDPVKDVAEIYREIEDLRDAPLLEGARGRPWGLDLTAATLTLEIDVPGALRDAYAQGFLESESADGIRSKYYGPPEQIGRAGRMRVAFSPRANPPERCEVFVDTFFDLRRVVAVGLKVGLDRLDARRGFSGSIRLTGASVEWRTAERPNDAGAADPRRESLSSVDRGVLGTLPPLELPAAADLVSSAGLQTTTNAAGSMAPGRSVSLDRVGAREFVVSIPPYQPDVAARSARASVVLPQPLNLLGRTVTVAAAISPGLRGVLTRPNLLGLELYDVDGRVLRGPVEGLSASIRFSPSGAEEASTWVRLEAAPFEGQLPQAMGHKDRGFRGDAVTRIGVRFEVGKHSDALLGPMYRTSGALLLSDFWITGTAAAPSAAADPLERPLPLAPPLAHRAEMLVGLNYAVIGFGTDVGIFPYGDRDISRGFSAHRQKLARDFDLFRTKGVDIVRVFLLGDLRSGLQYDAAGRVSGLDAAAMDDLDALIEAAGAHGLKLIPVLVDFLAADGVAESALLDRVVPVGEAPLVFTDPDHRGAFVDRALRPVVRVLADANRRWPGLIYAVDIVNEIENARAIFVPGSVPAVVDFVRTVRDMIRAEAPGISVTLGSRDRDALVGVWSDLDLDVWQFHHYDKMQAEEGRPLAYHVSGLGLEGPVILGEVEPADLAAKLDTIDANGYDAALFWSWRGLDGYVVNLDELAAWKDRRRASLGLRPGR